MLYDLKQQNAHVEHSSIGNDASFPCTDNNSIYDICSSTM